MLYPRGGKPMFEQLKNVVLQMIAEGKYKPGDILPSERELAEIYGVSRVTVRQALNVLVQDNVVFKKQGKGTFVSTKRIERKLDGLLGFVEEFVVSGMQCEVSVLKQKYVAAPADVIEVLRLPKNSEIFLLVRSISVEGHILGVDYTYLPSGVAYQFDKIDFRKAIVYRLLEKNGYKLISAEQTISAEIPDSQDCSLLSVTQKTPMLVIRRTVYVEMDLPISYSKALYRGDSYRYSLTLSRDSTDNLHFRHT
jgi:GntR family transcriptional regulator